MLCTVGGRRERTGSARIAVFPLCCPSHGERPAGAEGGKGGNLTQESRWPCSANKKGPFVCKAII